MKLSQTQLAEQTGIPQSMISRLERHGAEHLRRISQALGCLPGDLIA
jgi:DNA-binding Xre family transcriptional regulator